MPQPKVLTPSPASACRSRFMQRCAAVKFDHAVKCELTYDRVRFVFLSSYDKKGMPIPPDKNAGEDGLGALTLAPGDERHPFDSRELRISDIKKIGTSKGASTLKLNREQFLLAPIYRPTFSPV